MFPDHPIRKVRNAGGYFWRGRGEERYGKDHVGVELRQFTDVPLYIFPYSYS